MRVCDEIGSAACDTEIKLIQNLPCWEVDPLSTKKLEEVKMEVR